MESSNKQTVEELSILLIKVCKLYGVKITPEKTYYDLMREIIYKLSREQLEEYVNIFEGESGEMADKAFVIAEERLNELRKREQRVHHHSAATFKPVPNFITC